MNVTPSESCLTDAQPNVCDAQDILGNCQRQTAVLSKSFRRLHPHTHREKNISQSLVLILKPINLIKMII